MDLGLNEFRLDLLDYIKHHPDIDKMPFGLHSVVPASEDAPAGVIYVLKNRSNSVNIRDCTPSEHLRFSSHGGTQTVKMQFATGAKKMQKEASAPES